MRRKTAPPTELTIITSMDERAASEVNLEYKREYLNYWPHKDWLFGVFGLFGLFVLFGLKIRWNLMMTIRML